MKAAFVTTFGGPEVFEFRSAPVPTPGSKQVLAKVKAIGLNFADVLGRLGVYPGTPEPPFIPGMEFSGDVVAVGPDIVKLKIGERVMGYSRLGSHAEFAIVQEDLATTLPGQMSYEEGASFLVSYLTAYHSLIRLANLRNGEKLLIHAAAGGVGIASVQMAKYLGAEIFGTAGTDEKVALAGSHGAHHVVNYNTHDFAEIITHLTNGYGLDVIMDSVGGETYRKSWKLLAEMGRYILYGISSISGKGALNRLKAASAFSVMKPIFPAHLININKAIFGFNLSTLTGKEAYFAEANAELIRMYYLGVLKPLIGRVFRFDQIVDAHHLLQSRESIGKVVVVLD